MLMINFESSTLAINLVLVETCVLLNFQLNCWLLAIIALMHGAMSPE